jgi:hypothetical protein
MQISPMKPEKAVYASCATGSEGVSACRAQPGSEIGLMPDSALPVDILCWRPFLRQHVLSLLSRIAAPISLSRMRCGGHPLGRPMNPHVEVLMPRVTVLLARGIGFVMGSGGTGYSITAALRPNPDVVAARLAAAIAWQLIPAGMNGPWTRSRICVKHSTVASGAALPGPSETARWPPSAPPTGAGRPTGG